MYGTPEGFRVKSFSPKMFNSSKRSSAEIQRTPKNIGSLHTRKKFAKRSSQFLKKSDILVDQLQDDEEKKQYIREGTGIKPVKGKSYGGDDKAAKLKDVIHEDIENEDKVSVLSEKYTEERRPTDPENLLASHKVHSQNEFKRGLEINSSVELNRLVKNRSAMPNLLEPNNIKGKPGLKRSITANIEDDRNSDQSSRLRGKMAKLLKTVDLERKLQSKAVKKNKKEEAVEEEHEKRDITDYRRKGVLKQRRLSRINLGKQLALSETSGLKLQWIVDYKDREEGV